MATALPANYKCVLAPTKALQHSKVELTWDADDPRRRETTRKNFSKEELSEMDFKAYLADSSSEDESESESESEESEEQEESGGEGEPKKESARERKVKAKKAKKKEKRKKVRAKYKGLLQSIAGASEDGNDNKWSSTKEGRMEDMEITFTPGLGDSIAEVVDRAKAKREQKGEEEEEEAPFDAYLRRKEERQKEKRLRRKLKREQGGDDDEEEDEEELERQRAELELLVAKPGKKSATVFETNSQRKLSRKGKKRKKAEDKKKAEEEAKAASAKVLKDDRFAELFANPHEFELDPTNPHFKKTSADVEILAERRKRLAERSTTAGTKRTASATSAKDLVASIKRKTAATAAAAAAQEPKKKRQRRA